MVKEHTVEEDIRTQRVVNELYEFLETHGLDGMCIFDPSTKTLKEVDSVAINGTSLRLNAEPWDEEEEEEE